MSSGQPKAAVPGDLAGARQQQNQLLQYLLGFGGAPGSPGSNTNSSPINILNRGMGGMSRGGGPNAYIGGQSNPLDRLQQFFGGLGVPQSDLQRQGGDALGAMLRQPTPEQRAMDISMPALESMLQGYGPQFERDIASANQQGGRFGSSNAILRGEALRNLFNMRTQVAGTMGMLGQGAGQANRGLAGQAFGMGQQQAGQADIETQRRLQLLMQLLGVQQQNVYNVPLQQGGGMDWLKQLAGMGVGFAVGGPGGAAAGQQIASSVK